MLYFHFIWNAFILFENKNSKNNTAKPTNKQANKNPPKMYTQKRKVIRIRKVLKLVQIMNINSKGVYCKWESCNKMIDIKTKISTCQSLIKSRQWITLIRPGWVPAHIASRLCQHYSHCLNSKLKSVFWVLWYAMFLLVLRPSNILSSWNTISSSSANPIFTHISEFRVESSPLRILLDHLKQ